MGVLHKFIIACLQVDLREHLSLIRFTNLDHTIMNSPMLAGLFSIASLGQWLPNQEFILYIRGTWYRLSPDELTGMHWYTSQKVTTALHVTTKVCTFPSVCVKGPPELYSGAWVTLCRHNECRSHLITWPNSEESEVNQISTWYLINWRRPHLYQISHYTC